MFDSSRKIHDYVGWEKEAIAENEMVDGHQIKKNVFFLETFSPSTCETNLASQLKFKLNL